MAVIDLPILLDSSSFTQLTVNEKRSLKAFLSDWQPQFVELHRDPTAEYAAPEVRERKSQIYPQTTLLKTMFGYDSKLQGCDGYYSYYYIQNVVLFIFRPDGIGIRYHRSIVDGVLQSIRDLVDSILETVLEEVVIPLSKKKINELTYKKTERFTQYENRRLRMPTKYRQRRMPTNSRIRIDWGNFLPLQLQESPCYSKVFIYLDKPHEYYHSFFRTQADCFVGDDERQPTECPEFFMPQFFAKMKVITDKIHPFLAITKKAIPQRYFKLTKEGYKIADKLFEMMKKKYAPSMSIDQFNVIFGIKDVSATFTKVAFKDDTKYYVFELFKQLKNRGIINDEKQSTVIFCHCFTDSGNLELERKDVNKWNLEDRHTTEINNLLKNLIK